MVDKHLEVMDQTLFLIIKLLLVVVLGQQKLVVEMVVVLVVVDHIMVVKEAQELQLKVIGVEMAEQEETLTILVEVAVLVLLEKMQLLELVEEMAA